MQTIAIQRRICAVGPLAWPADLHPVLARVYAARGVAADAPLELKLAALVSPSTLGGLDRACELLIDAIDRNARICIVGDFDADGATGTAVAVRGLRLLGARDVGFRVPHRMTDGYGLSPGLVESLRDEMPQLLVTVDNGIACHAGVAAARSRGMRVIVTDHHLPGATLPDADAIVNPNLDGDAFPSKALAGVGVMFYLLLALRARLREVGRFANRDEPDLSVLLDLVALGTVADLVPLDANNRVLVAAGLRRMRAGKACAGVVALCRTAGRDVERLIASDLAFALAPRINAAGRLEDMRLGIECLLADDAETATTLAERLSAINAQRKDMQTAMVEQGEAIVAAFVAEHGTETLPHGVVLFQDDWHPGVIGLVASKLKERLHRPVIAFAPAAPGSDELRGSARSITGFHLRDALAEVDARCPGMIARFGGHAMAAGLTLSAARLAAFAAEFDAVARRLLDAAALRQVIWSDGELAPHEFCLDLAQALRLAGPWGQGFPEPLFDNPFELESWRLVGERHMQLKLRAAGLAGVLEAIMFNADDYMPPPPHLRAAYQLDVDTWNGCDRMKLLIRHIEPL